MKKKTLVSAIAAVSVLALVGCAGNNEDSATSSTSTSESIAVEATVPTNNSSEAGAAASGSTTAATTANAGGQISQEEAKQIALSHAGIAEADATFVLASLDYENGVQVYEVEFYSGTTEYDYTIDAASGEIISYDLDAEGYGNQNAGSSSSGDIGEEQARSIALAKVPGASDSDIRIYQNMEDGVTVYEGSIIYNEIEYEFEIRASDGTILEWSEESIYD